MSAPTKEERERLRELFVPVVRMHGVELRCAPMFWNDAVTLASEYVVNHDAVIIAYEPFDCGFLAALDALEAATSLLDKVRAVSGRMSIAAASGVDGRRACDQINAMLDDGRERAGL